MTQLALPARSFDPLGVIARLFRKPSTPAAMPDPDQSRARRAFVIDRLDNNPDAFASEYDVQAMMALYPRAF